MRSGYSVLLAAKWLHMTACIPATRNTCERERERERDRERESE
eukprot:COSAG03_NODE_19486_length_335_cov_1.597458_1_plen_42_part_10